MFLQFLICTKCIYYEIIYKSSMSCINTIMNILWNILIDIVRFYCAYSYYYWDSMTIIRNPTRNLLYTKGCRIDFVSYLINFLTYLSNYCCKGTSFKSISFGNCNPSRMEENEGNILAMGDNFTRVMNYCTVSRISCWY